MSDPPRREEEPAHRSKGVSHEIVVPDSKLADSIVTNYYLPRKRPWVRCDVGVSCGSELEKVEPVSLQFVKRLHAGYEREGIVIPFPIRTLHVPEAVRVGVPSSDALPGTGGPARAADAHRPSSAAGAHGPSRAADARGPAGSGLPERAAPGR